MMSCRHMTCPCRISWTQFEMCSAVWTIVWYIPLLINGKYFWNHSQVKEFQKLFLILSLIQKKTMAHIKTHPVTAYLPVVKYILIASSLTEHHHRHQMIRGDRRVHQSIDIHTIINFWHCVSINLSTCFLYHFNVYIHISVCLS